MNKVLVIFILLFMSNLQARTCEENPLIYSIESVGGCTKKIFKDNKGDFTRCCTYLEDEFPGKVNLPELNFDKKLTRSTGVQVANDIGLIFEDMRLADELLRTTSLNGFINNELRSSSFNNCNIQKNLKSHDCPGVDGVDINQIIKEKFDLNNIEDLSEFIRNPQKGQFQKLQCQTTEEQKILNFKFSLEQNLAGIIDTIKSININELEPQQYQENYANGTSTNFIDAKEMLNGLADDVRFEEKRPFLFALRKLPLVNQLFSKPGYFEKFVQKIKAHSGEMSIDKFQEYLYKNEGDFSSAIANSCTSSLNKLRNFICNDIEPTSIGDKISLIAPFTLKENQKEYSVDAFAYLKTTCQIIDLKSNSCQSNGEVALKYSKPGNKICINNFFKDLNRNSDSSMEGDTSSPEAALENLKICVSKNCSNASDLLTIVDKATKQRDKRRLVNIFSQNQTIRDASTRPPSQRECIQREQSLSNLELAESLNCFSNPTSNELCNYNEFKTLYSYEKEKRDKSASSLTAGLTTESDDERSLEEIFFGKPSEVFTPEEIAQVETQLQSEREGQAVAKTKYFDSEDISRSARTTPQAPREIQATGQAFAPISQTQEIDLRKGLSKSEQEEAAGKFGQLGSILDSIKKGLGFGRAQDEQRDTPERTGIVSDVTPRPGQAPRRVDTFNPFTGPRQRGKTGGFSGNGNSATTPYGGYPNGSLVNGPAIFGNQSGASTSVANISPEEAGQASSAASSGTSSAKSASGPRLSSGAATGGSSRSSASEGSKSAGAGSEIDYANASGFLPFNPQAQAGEQDKVASGDITIVITQDSPTLNLEQYLKERNIILGPQSKIILDIQIEGAKRQVTLRPFIHEKGFIYYQIPQGETERLKSKMLVEDVNYLRSEELSPEFLEQQILTQY